MSTESNPHQPYFAVVTPVILTAAGLREYLGIGEDTLADLIAEGLPYTCLGGARGKRGSARTFHRGLVEEWIREKAIRESKPKVKPQGRGVKKKKGEGAEVAAGVEKVGGKYQFSK